MNNTINSGEQTYVKPSVGSTIGGVAAGAVVTQLVPIPHKILAPKIVERVGDISRNLSNDEFTAVSQATKEILKNSGLEKKGVEIIRASAKNVDEVAEIMKQELDGNLFTRFLPNSVKTTAGSLAASTVKNGNNAFYAFRTRKVVIPDAGLSLATFHELGHAANANLSKIGKVLQKSRPLMMLAIPIALIALFKNKKQKGQEPKGTMDKATTFVKNNAGKLTFAAFLPMLLEEGLATFKGNGFAKQLLNPELARKVSKSNALGFATYLGMAALTSLGIFLGVKVKDAITDKSIAKKQAQAAQ